MSEHLYSVRELARHFDVGENYIFSMVREGKLKAHETNPIKVSEEEVKRYCQSKVPETLFKLEPIQLELFA
jgi:transposase|tara:strand:- start:5214 stop:5426 length:213 start_codon:yes stop_codon:yes gene_type:complete